MDPSPRPLPSDYHGLWPRFDLEVVKRYAHNSHIPEMVPVIFYAMMMPSGLSRRLTMDVVMWAMRKLDWGPVEVWLGDNDQRLRRAQASHPADSPANPMLAGDPSRGRTSSFRSFCDTLQAAEYVRGNLHWSKRETSSLRPNLLPWNFSAYWPEFNHIVVMQFAHAAYIPEMVQAIFYAMVINNAARLQLTRREIGETLMSDLRKLRWDVIKASLLFIEDKLKDTRR
ncbi:LOW QUALITY PROTEIN: hypothetical protein Cgig2_015392 [Carnegiea gigantea]|uniref:Uncharacterized protein n=1 Tax=Carnegiea gigantea TaxID=171969 RepID=A0A9Q1JTS6_9CARY|nr:LOW QUALITY PROTEIN: hypothetical protein Cgig2_015392 [Carnegiea gigantea]